MIERAVVGALLYTQRAEVLLQLRDNKPDLPYANCWTLFGGAVEEGETPGEAIRRELVEELDLVIPMAHWKSYVCHVRSIPGQVRTLNHLYHGELRVDPESLTLHEGQAMRLFKADDACNLTLAFAQTPQLLSFLIEYLRLDL
jgi:8-oxo-dGTP diphosphatase